MCDVLLKPISYALLSVRLHLIIMLVVVSRVEDGLVELKGAAPPLVHAFLHPRVLLR
jgi:hypothetical protein